MSDINAIKHKMFDWSEGKRAASLQSVYEECLGKIDSSIAWYRDKRSSKRKIAWCFRVGAIALGAVTAAMPTVAEIAAKDGAITHWWLRPGVITIGGIVVGALLMMDKLIGASSAWIRYTMAETTLKELRDEMVLQYAIESGQWAGEGDASIEQTRNALTVARGFLTRANQIILDETNHWKDEFQNALAQTEEYAKLRPTRVEEAVVTITLQNPERLAGAWTLAVNSGNDEPVTGDSKSLRLLPGAITVRVRATVKAGTDDQGTARFETEKGDIIVAGSAKVITITLPAKQG